MAPYPVCSHSSYHCIGQTEAFPLQIQVAVCNENGNGLVVNTHILCSPVSQCVYLSVSSSCSRALLICCIDFIAPRSRSMLPRYNAIASPWGGVGWSGRGSLRVAGCQGNHRTPTVLVVVLVKTSSLEDLVWVELVDSTSTFSSIVECVILWFNWALVVIKSSSSFSRASKDSLSDGKNQQNTRL